MSIFPEAMDGVQGFVRFASVTGNDEYFAHGEYLMSFDGLCCRFRQDPERRRLGLAVIG
jgi:hypothetical protein